MTKTTGSERISLGRRIIQATKARTKPGLGIALIDAAARDDAMEAAKLLSIGAHLEFQDCHGARAIHHAAHRGSLATLSLCIHMGAELNPQERFTLLTPLANSLRHPKAAALLLAAGACTEIADISACTPLLTCAVQGLDETSLILLKAGASMKTQEATSSGTTPLIYAASFENAGCARILLAAGADPNDLNAQGESPLMLAATHCKKSTSCLELLSEAGGRVTQSESELLVKIAQIAHRLTSPHHLGMLWLVHRLKIVQDARDIATSTIFAPNRTARTPSL